MPKLFQAISQYSPAVPKIEYACLEWPVMWASWFASAREWYSRRMTSTLSRMVWPARDLSGCLQATGEASGPIGFPVRGLDGSAWPGHMATSLAEIATIHPPRGFERD
jgi:hypothetical protein